jgi:hypothetical protein
LITAARLTEILGFFPCQAVVDEIDAIELFSRERSVTIPVSPADLVVERSAIVRLLAEKAFEAGVKIRGGCKLVDLQPTGKGLEVTIQHRPLRRELSLHLLIRTILNRFCSADYARLLSLLNEETVRLLGLYNRDQAARMLCRILLVQLRLLGFATLISRRNSSGSLPRRTRARSNRAVCLFS